MNQTLHFLNRYQLSSTHPDMEKNKFDKPIRIGTYAIKLNSNQPRTLIDNADELHRKYSLDRFNRQGLLDLTVPEYWKFPQSKEILKLNGDLDSLLRYIIDHKDVFLTEKSKSSNESSVAKSVDESTEAKRDGKSTSGPASDLEAAMNKLDLSTGDSATERKLLHSDFIGLRSVFACLLNCHYANDTITVYAELFEGNIYLRLDKENRDSNVLKMVADNVYNTKKFELYCTEPFEKKDTKRTQEEVGRSSIENQEDLKRRLKERAKQELVFVYSANLNDHSLIYSASMESFESYHDLNENPIPSDELNAVQLKICRRAKTKYQIDKFYKVKTLKWWAQSVLTNNKKISVGFYNNERLLVNGIKEYSLSDLATYRNGFFWRPEVCFDQMAKILSFIKKSFEAQKNTKRLQFRHLKGSKKFVCSPSTVTVVPEYYKKEMSTKSID